LTRADGTDRVHGWSKTPRVSQRISRALRISHRNCLRGLSFEPLGETDVSSEDAAASSGLSASYRELQHLQLMGEVQDVRPGVPTIHLHPCPPQVGRGAESSRRRTVGRCGSVVVHPNVYVNTYLRPPRIDKSVDNLPLLWRGNDPATMCGRLHGECCLCAIVAGAPHFRRTRSCPSRRRLGRPYGQAQNRSLSHCRRPSIGRRGQSNSAGLP
jgi:hypothetical protein